MIQSEFAGCNAVRFFPKQLVVAELDQDSPQPKCFLVSPPGCSTRSRFALEHSLINLAVASEVGSGDTKLDAIQFMIMARVWECVHVRFLYIKVMLHCYMLYIYIVMHYWVLLLRLHHWGGAESQARWQARQHSGSLLRVWDHGFIPMTSTLPWHLFPSFQSLRFNTAPSWWISNKGGSGTSRCGSDLGSWSKFMDVTGTNQYWTNPYAQPVTMKCHREPTPSYNEL